MGNVYALGRIRILKNSINTVILGFLSKGNEQFVEDYKRITRRDVLHYTGMYNPKGQKSKERGAGEAPRDLVSVPHGYA